MTETQEEFQGKRLAEAFAGSSPQDRERLARIVDLLPCYVVLLDGEHRIRFYNKTVVDLFGPINDSPCYAQLRGEVAECELCTPMHSLRGNVAGIMEWIHHKSNHVFRVYSYPFTEADGSRFVLKVGFNITATIRVQQALDLSKQSYRVITDNLSIGIALLAPDLRLKAGNSRITQWFGKRVASDVRLCDILLCPTYEQGLTKSGSFCKTCPFEAALSDNSTHESEFPITFADGKQHFVRLVARPVAPHKGNVRAVIMMLEDITQRLHINQQLQRARKLEAMSTLAGGIAHEINQPLSALHLYAGGLQLLLEKQEGVSPEVTQERLALIMREADKIRSIISHMRSLVMKEGHAPVQALPPAPIVNGSLAIMRKQFADRGVRVQTILPKNLPPVYSNAVQLEQVLVNLLTNALHALDAAAVNAQTVDREADSATDSESGEKAAAGVESTPKYIRIRAFVKQDTKKVVLEVADTGPGLPQGSERIFDPFYTTKEQHQGMGLGLSIVHGFVSLWGGQVYAVPRHPELGGAAFYVELRIADEAQAGKTEENGVPE